MSSQQIFFYFFVVIGLFYCLLLYKNGANKMNFNDWSRYLCFVLIIIIDMWKYAIQCSLYTSIRKFWSVFIQKCHIMSLFVHLNLALCSLKRNQAILVQLTATFQLKQQTNILFLFQCFLIYVQVEHCTIFLRISFQISGVLCTSFVNSENCGLWIQCEFSFFWMTAFTGA